MQQGEETDRIFSPFLEAWTVLKLLLNVVECLKLWTLGHTTFRRTNDLKHGESAWARAQNCPLPYKDHARALWVGQENSEHPQLPFTAAGCTTESCVTAHWQSRHHWRRVGILPGRKLHSSEEWVENVHTFTLPWWLDGTFVCLAQQQRLFSSKGILSLFKKSGFRVTNTLLEKSMVFCFMWHRVPSKHLCCFSVLCRLLHYLKYIKDSDGFLKCKQSLQAGLLSCTLEFEM